MECHGKCLHCTNTRPQYLLDINNMMCTDCNIELRPIMGKHQNTKEVEECCVCLQDKPMTILNCKHKMCNGCWYTIANQAYDQMKSPKCPLCRKANIKSPYECSTGISP